MTTMDPIEALELCRQGALRGEANLTVDVIIKAADCRELWRREPQRVRSLLDELLCAPHVEVGLELLMSSGACSALFPELVAVKDLSEDPVSALHKNVWDHTEQVVANVAPVVELRWGSLMHDIGKARTRRFVAGRVTFHNHDFVGAQMLDDLEARLGLFNDDASLFTTVRALVLNHLRPAGYSRSWTDAGVRRLLADMGGLRNFERLMALSRADLTTKNPTKRDRALARAGALEARMVRVYAADHAPRLPKGTMGIIIDSGTMPRGRELNVVRAELERMLRDGELPTGKDASWYATEGLRILRTRPR